MMARYCQDPETFITPVGMFVRPALPMFTQPPPLIWRSHATTVPVMPATEMVVLPFKQTEERAGVAVPPTEAATTFTEVMDEYCEEHGEFCTSARNSYKPTVERVGLVMEVRPALPILVQDPPFIRISQFTTVPF